MGHKQVFCNTIISSIITVNYGPYFKIPSRDVNGISSHVRQHSRSKPELIYNYTWYFMYVGLLPLSKKGKVLIASTVTTIILRKMHVEGVRESEDEQKTKSSPLLCFFSHSQRLITQMFSSTPKRYAFLTHFQLLQNFNSLLTLQLVKFPHEVSHRAALGRLLICYSVESRLVSMHWLILPHFGAVYTC